MSLPIRDYTGWTGQWYGRVVNGKVITNTDIGKVRPGFFKVAQSPNDDTLPAQMLVAEPPR